MSKNYTNYSNKSVNKEQVEAVAEETVEEQVVESVEETTKEEVIEETVETPVEETKEEVEEETLGIGVVTDCLKLNVRKQPSKDAEVLKTIDALTEVVILKEVNDFYEVALKTGESGYCMKKYIAVNK